MKIDQLCETKVKSKAEVILYIYDLLTSGKSVNSFQLMNEFNISNRTFRRYISDINAYLYNQYKNVQVVYDRQKKEYILK